MSIHSKYYKGSLIFFESNFAHWLQGIGASIVQYIDDFTSLPVDDTTGFPTAYTTTAVNASTVTQADAEPGALLITTAGAENDGVNLQLNGESFQLTSARELNFSIRYKVSEATQSDFFFGLAITDTDILGGATDLIGFRKADASAAVEFVLEKGSTETAVAAVLTQDAATYHTLAFHFDGSKVEVYVDNALVATPAVTNLPDDEALRVSLQFLTGDTSAETCTIDWVRCIQLGR